MISHDGNNLVFLLSMPRSGSTLLGMMLGSHPGVHCPPEPWIQLPLAEMASQHDERRTLYDDYTATIATAAFLESIAARPEARAALSAALQEFLASKVSRRDAALFARTVYNESLDAAGKTVFVDKTPRYYHALDFIGSQYPAAKSIFLRRDPLDVALSYRTTWNVSVDEMAGKVATAHTVDFAKGIFALEQYAAANRHAVLNTSYEELVRDPERSLRQICAFLDIDYSANMLAFYDNAELMALQRQSPVGDRKVLRAGRKTDVTSIGKWIKEFTHSDLSKLIAFLGADIFVRLGYDSTLEKLRALGIELPSEREAEERRAEALAGDVQRSDTWPLLSKWSFFISGIKADPSARDTLLRLLYRLAGDHAVVTEREGHVSLDLAIKLLQAEHHLAERLGAIDELTNGLKKADQERTAHLSAIGDLTNALGVSVAKNEALLEVLRRLPVRIALRLFRIPYGEASQERDAKETRGVPGGSRE